MLHNKYLNQKLQKHYNANFSDQCVTKFSETKTETFFRDQFFLKSKARLFFRDQIAETETLKNLAKVSRPKPKPRFLNIFWNEIRKIWDLQAKLEFLGPKFGTLIVNWVKIISAR